MTQTNLFGRVLRRIGTEGLHLVQLGCIVHCTWEFLGGFALCSGPSMEPTIHESDIILTDRLSVHRGEIERGDVVILSSPTHPRVNLCKRVTGIEGDYIDEPPKGYSYSYVPRGHIWVEGDNKKNSVDSRSFGPVPFGLLKSRVFYKVWPTKDFGTVPRDDSVDLS